MKKIMSLLLVVVLTMSVFNFDVFASEVNVVVNEDDQYAEKLSEVGMFVGSENGYELEREATRLEGLVMLIRLLGKENEVENYQVNDQQFEDVPEWGMNYVQYAYDNGLTKGVSNDQFGSQDYIDSKSYMTFVLRALGYDDSKGDFSWDNAVEKAVDLGIVKSENKERLSDFTRSDVAEISYNALRTKHKNEEKILLEMLVASGDIDVNDAIRLEAQFEENVWNKLPTMDELNEMDSLFEEYQPETKPEAILASTMINNMPIVSNKAPVIISAPVTIVNISAPVTIINVTAPAVVEEEPVVVEEEEPVVIEEEPVVIEEEPVVVEEEPVVVEEEPVVVEEEPVVVEEEPVVVEEEPVVVEEEPVVVEEEPIVVEEEPVVVEEEPIVVEEEEPVVVEEEPIVVEEEPIVVEEEPIVVEEEPVVVEEEEPVVEEEEEPVVVEEEEPVVVEEEPIVEEEEEPVVVEEEPIVEEEPVVVEEEPIVVEEEPVVVEEEPVVVEKPTVVEEGFSIVDAGAIADASISNNNIVGTDSTDAFQYAVDHYDTIIIPEGDFRIAGTIVIKRPVKIISQGGRIYADPVSGTKTGIFYVESGGSNSEFRDMDVRSIDKYLVYMPNDKPTALSSNRAFIYGNGSQNILIENCYTKNLMYSVHGFGMDDLEISNCRFEENYIVIWLGDDKDVYIHDTFLSTSPTADIYAHCIYIGFDTYDITISNITVEQTSEECGSIINFAWVSGDYGKYYIHGLVVDGVTILPSYTVNQVVQMYGVEDAVFTNIHGRVYDNSLDGTGTAMIKVSKSNGNIVFNDCDIIFDELTTLVKSTDSKIQYNESIEFNNCNFTINKLSSHFLKPYVQEVTLNGCTLNFGPNTLTKYRGLYEAGVKIVFENCDINFYDYMRLSASIKPISGYDVDVTIDNCTFTGEKVNGSYFAINSVSDHNFTFTNNHLVNFFEESRDTSSMSCMVSSKYINAFSHYYEDNTFGWR